jgi:hypothetical protein
MLSQVEVEDDGDNGDDEVVEGNNQQQNQTES